MSALTQAGLADSNTAAAALVGETRQAWRRYVQGETSPSEGKLQAWTDELAAGGIQAHFELTAGGWQVQVTRSPKSEQRLWRVLVEGRLEMVLSDEDAPRKRVGTWYAERALEPTHAADLVELWMTWCADNDLELDPMELVELATGAAWLVEVSTRPAGAPVEGSLQALGVLVQGGQTLPQLLERLARFTWPQEPKADVVLEDDLKKMPWLQVRPGIGLCAHLDPDTEATIRQGLRGCAAGYRSPSELSRVLLEHAEAGFRRPGSWERGWLSSVVGL